MMPRMSQGGEVRAAPRQLLRSIPLPGARSALILLLLLNLFNYIDRQVVPSVEVPIRQTFGVTQAMTGWLATGFLLVYMVTSPIFGWLADRTSRWLLVGIGITLQAVFTAGSGASTSFAMLLVMRCGMGIGDAAYGPAAPTLIADMYPIEQRGRKLAWFYAAIPVGSALGYGVGGLMRALTDDWRWAFFVIVPPMVLLGILCFFRKDPKPVAARTAAQRPVRFRDYLDLLKNRSYVLNCAGMTAMTFAIGGIAFWMPAYLEDDRGLDQSVANLGFGAIVVVAGLVATLAGGYVGDLLRRRYSGSYFLVSGIGLMAGFPLTLLLLVTPFPYAWVIMVLAVFCLFFNTGPSNTIIANVTHPSIRASAFAFNIFIIHALGDAISPPIIGYVAHRTSMKLGFALVSVMMLVGGLLWLWGARYLENDTRAADAADNRSQ